MENEADAIENNLEQSQESAESVHTVTRAEADALQAATQALYAELKTLPEGDLVGQIVENALKLLRDRTTRGDVKLINKAMKELRYALKVFSPYRETRKVSIFGSARTPENHADYKGAAEFGKLMAQAGWMVITGAGGGIMAAGHGGAGPEPSFGLAIRLPFEQRTNLFIENNPKLINFKYFFTRKLMFVRSSHAIGLFPGGFGTMDEGFEVLTLIQTGKSVPMPIVMIDEPGGDFWKSWQRYVVKHLLGRKLINPEDLHLYKITDSVEEAVEEVCRFYSNYHSMRYSRDDLILRLHRRPSAEQLASLNERFKDIVVKGSIHTSSALPIERDEPTLANLHRLVFHFNKREHGKLRMMIDQLNLL